MGQLLCILVLALGIGAVSARAALRPADAAATHRYLLARIALKRQDARTGAGALAVWQALASRFSSECPGILSGTPLAGPKPASELASEYADGKLEFELGFSLLTAPDALERSSDAVFYDAVRRLRWSNRALTRLLHELALQSMRRSELPAPDLCGDLRYWVASGYLAYSPATEHFDLQVEGIIAMAPIDLLPGEPKGLDFEQRVAYRLRKYEAPADRRLAGRAFPVAQKLNESAARPVLEALEKVNAALGRQTA